MRSSLIGATLIGAATVAATVAWRWPSPVAPASNATTIAARDRDLDRDRDRGPARDRDQGANHRTQPEHEDSRSKLPGVHRAGPAELAVRNRVAAAESAKIRARLAEKAKGQVGKAASVAAIDWVSLGPTNAPREFNGFEIAGVDSGRPNTIVVNPRDPNIVYMAVSGGGVWKTFNFLAPGGPTWSPATDTLPNLAVGALALDPAQPDTLYLGSGDFSDGSGDTIFKSTDGGSTWRDPVVLDGTYPGNVRARVSSVHQIGVAGTRVYAATDAGLFASTDAGATFALVDLPNTEGRLLAETVWSIVPIGGGGWVASGVTSCGAGQPPPGLFGGAVDPQFCPLGNYGAMWRTEDGTTWAPITNLPTLAGTGHTTIASGPTDDPKTTVLYAWVGAVYGQATLGFWRSRDGGQSWVDATGTLANPTLVAQNGDDSCLDTNIGNDQSWYNQAIVVDPTNPDHVLVGGNLCGMRTLNGTADLPTWELVAHWLPGPGYGETAHGRLPYVHADWHTATSVATAAGVRTFAGTDGGIFSSTNLFDAATPAEAVVWTHANRGLVTHLMYSVASGDPATGDPFVLFSGLQDNGTRFRADPQHPADFNQPIGGDGIGATVHTSTAGTTYWASVEYGWAYCKPAEADCAIESTTATTDAEAHWHAVPSPVGLTPGEIQARAEARARTFGDDREPFFVHFANVETDTTGPSVLTHTDGQVFVAIGDGATGYTWRSISQDLSVLHSGAGISNIAASRTIAGLYGAAGMSPSEPFYVTTQGTTKVDWRPARAVVSPSAGIPLTGASSIDFPPVTPTGKQPGDVFIGAFTGNLADADRTPPPDAEGHLWRTTDHGQTWQSIVGADPAHRLPNVAIYVVKYDPVAPATIYAGTDLGVYVTTDDGVTWDRMGEGLPMVPARDLYVAKNQDFIRVATYGRGLWEIYPSAAASHGAAGNGDYDRNLKLDWIDLAAVSSRLGTTPATTTAPRYSWIMDLSPAGSDPPVQAIDGADFDALLANFGGHP
jgi:hypothetical protein